MASSQLTSTATAVSTSTENVPAAKENESEIQNDPDFAIICAFFQKFAKELGIDIPNFGQLNKWLISTDEVSPHLRDMHIKLLRKTRKTVHEKSWESALSKFCFSYSAQDAWEIERFGYKRSSFKVKLRILRELLESQFDRNNKFRTKLLTLSADSLRSQPIGRDKLGHTYWLTQDDDCNLRIYQEHLDEEIWRVVATNREELVNLIARLRGNEVVLPSADIGIVDEDTSSSNSCIAPIERPPPPEEQDDSQEEPAIKVPNLRIRLGANKNKPDQEECSNADQEENLGEEGKFKTKNDAEENADDSKIEPPKKVKPLIISQRGNNSPSISTGSKRRNNNEEDSVLSPPKEEQIVKKLRPSLLDSRRSTKPNKYFKSDEEECSSLDGELDDEEAEEEDIDSVAAEEDDNEEKDIEEYDDDDYEGEVSEEIEDPTVYVHGSGSGRDCNAGRSIRDPDELEIFFSSFEVDDELSFSDIIEESVLVIFGQGNGHDCFVGNKNEESPTKSNEPKATFFFGEPGCLKLSPIKLNPNTAENNKPEKETTKSCNSISERGGDLDLETKFNKKNSVESNDFTDKTSEIDQSELNGEKGDALKEMTGAPNCDRKVSENTFKELADPKSTKPFEDKETKKNSKNNEDMNNGSQQSVKNENTNISSGNETSNVEIPEVNIKSDSNENKSETETKTDSMLSVQTQSSVSQSLKVFTKKETQTSTVAEEAEDVAQSRQILVDSRKSEIMSSDHSKSNIAHTDSSSFAKRGQEQVASNRKRRLSDFQTSSQPIRSASESDLDPNTDRPDESPAADDILDDIGGKRPKMRTKCSNIEIRKKVEAKLDANLEETTSSSGDEDLSRPRKTCSGKKEIQKMPVKKDEPNTSGKLDTRDFKTSPKEIIKSNLHASISSTSIDQIKQKPTLTDVVEKKIKKSALKSKEESAILQEKIVPLKKSPVTKPLKKNLLTQLRESDEEAVPRKRTLSNIGVVNKSSGVTSLESEVMDSDLKKDIYQKAEEQLQTTEEKECSIEQNTLPSKALDQETTKNSTDSRKNSERKRQNSEEPLTGKTTLDDVNKGSNDDSNDNVKKSRDSTIKVEIKTDKKNFSDMEKMSCNSLAEADINDQKDGKEVAVKEEITENALMVNRRSSRRSGSTFYTELPQLKRTRASNKSVTKINIVTEQNTTEKMNIEKSESVALTKPTTALDEKDSTEKQAAVDKIKSEKINEVPSKPVTDNGGSKEKTNLSNSEEKANLSNSSDNIEDQIKVNSVQKPQEMISGTSPGIGPCSGSGSGPGRGRGPRKKREVDTKNIIDEETDAPVRQSRRIAQQKIREEAERRKLEEIALRTMKQELKKKKKAEKEADPTVIEPSEHSSSSSDSEVETKKKSKKKCPGKDGWSSGSEEVEEPEEEDEYPHHYESDAGSPLFKSDHEFSPESDLEDETQVVPMKRARTARKEDAEDDNVIGDEEACQKCGKSDHPEWILLCDICDKGYHCSCLTPILFYIPEGDWYCPPCQQEQLIVALEKQLQEFDELVEKKRIANEEEKRLAELAEREEQARLKEEEDQRRERRKQKHKKRHRNGSSDENSSFDSDKTDKTDSEDVAEIRDNVKKHNIKDVDSGDDSKSSKPTKRSAVNVDKSKGRRGEGRNRRRRAAARGTRRRRRLDKAGSSASSYSGSSSNSSSGSGSESSSGSFSDSDDEPIYKLRKRRQINVSYRLNEYDDLINSALKKEMDEIAGAGNAGRGKDITTIIEADKEEKARLKQIEEKGNGAIGADEERKESRESSNEGNEKKTEEKQDDSDDEKPLKNKSKPIPTIKKKSRKLTTLDISSEEDDGSDEDFKTSSFEDEEEDEDTSNTASTDSDTSLEIFRRKGKSAKKQRKAARRAARERRKVKKFVVDDSDDEEENVKPKKKRNNDSDYTESETDDNDELSELSENIDSAELCDDTTSEESDGAWHPSKKKKKRKTSTQGGHGLEKSKKLQTKKPKQLEYSDDDISETEDEEDDDDEDDGGGKGSGKQPRSQPLIPVNLNKASNSGKKGKPAASAKKKLKKMQSEEELSFSDSGDSTRRTRGRRYAYIEDFDDDSSDGGIKPGVKRPDTPPEEREKFIKKQEEIKRMLAEKNAEGAKLAATPRLTPIKALGGGISSEKDKRSPVKMGQDSLSTVPLSVIRQAKVLDIDYLQRKGESIGDLENPDEVDSEFDDADLPDDLPEDMDEDAIARMVEEEEEFGTGATTRELPAPDEVVRSPNKSKNKEAPIPMQKIGTNSSLEALSQMQGGTPNVTISVAPTTMSGLQEPTRKRLPMPTFHPPLLRHQYPHSPHTQSGNIMLHGSTMPRHPPPTHLLQNALSAPLGQPLNRNLPIQHAHNATSSMPVRTHLPPTRATQSERVAAPGGTSVSTVPVEGDTKPRGRRKKITPLRDPMQKQAASSAVSALNLQSDKITSGSRASTVVSSSSNTTSSVIKTSASSLSVSQPPHLYKTQSDASIVSETQTSVITRLPLVSPSRMIFPGADVARFYNTLPAAGTAGGPRQLAANAQRPHRGPPLQMPPGLPPSLTAPSYVPSHTRHAPSHLNPYRPPIYGNPSFIQSRPLPSAAVNMRLGSAPSTGPEYLGGPRPFPPYSYYPPPPPLTTTHHSTPPSSVIVAAPSATSSVVQPAAENPPTQTATTHTTSEQVSSANLKSTTPDELNTTNKPTSESTKKLMTLDVYTSSNEKSPLGIGGGESSGSQPEAADDSSSSGLQSQAKAGEFSGLVSYFSSQHDDYNT